MTEIEKMYGIVGSDNIDSNIQKPIIKNNNPVVQVKTIDGSEVSMATIGYVARIETENANLKTKVNELEAKLRRLEQRVTMLTHHINKTNGKVNEVENYLDSWKDY